jgi:hypothetical protein
MQGGQGRVESQISTRGKRTPEFTEKNFWRENIFFACRIFLPEKTAGMCPNWDMLQQFPKSLETQF